MNILHSPLIPAAILALSLCACEKELDFDYAEIDPVTVIEATLDMNGATVAITQTTPMDEPMDTTLLTGASVTLTDMTDGSRHTLMPDSDGKYLSATSGVPGHSYRIDVDINGEQFSAQSVMQQPVRITDIAMEWIKMPYDHVAIMKVEFTDNPASTGDSYWLRLYRNGKPYRWSVGDDRAASCGTISAIQMTTRRDTTAEDDDDLLVDGDVIRATVAQIDTPMYRMLESLTAGGSNGPQLWQGRKPCLGYFLAAPVADTLMVFHPDSIPG